MTDVLTKSESNLTTLAMNSPIETSGEGGYQHQLSNRRSLVQPMARYLKAGDLSYSAQLNVKIYW